MSFHGEANNKILPSPNSSADSSHGSEYSRSNHGGRESIRDFIMDPGDDEEFDPSEFVETRIQLHNLDHNLVIFCIYHDLMK